LVGGNQAAFMTGMRVRAIHSDTPTYFLEGNANYIGGGSLLITVDKFNGSGSHNSWTFAVAGEVGQTGATGATGSSGVIAVTAPITNSGTSTSANLGFDQSGRTLAQSQVTGLTTALDLKAALTANQTFTGTQTLIPGSTIVPLIVRAHSSGTANILTVQSSTPTVLAGINNIGQVFTGSTVPLVSSTFNAQLSVKGPTTTTAVPIAIFEQGVTGTGNLSEWRASGGTTPLAKISSDGSLLAANLSAPVGGYTSYGDYLWSTNVAGLNYNSAAYISPKFTDHRGYVVKGQSSQTGDLIQTQRSDSTILSGINANGQIYSGLTTIKGSTVALTAATYNSATSVTFQYAGTTSLVTAGQLVTVAGCTPSNLNGTWAVASISGSSGAWTFIVAGSGFTANGSAFGTFQLPAQASITASSAGTVGLVVKGVANQTSNLQEWQDSNGNIQVRVDSSGNILASTLRTIGLNTNISEQNSGISITGSRATGQATSPGSNKATLYFRDGTNAGTLKLVVRAGAAGAETTILDNIPQ
jgi:hypothetical protein